MADSRRSGRPRRRPAGSAGTVGSVTEGATDASQPPGPERVTGTVERAATGPAESGPAGTMPGEAATAAGPATGTMPGEAATAAGPATGTGSGESATAAGEPTSAARRPRSPEVPAGLAWERLRSSLRSRPSQLQLLAGALLFLLGFAVITQARQTSESGLSGLRESDLIRLLDDVTDLRERLERENTELVDQRDRLLNSSDSTEEARRAAAERSETYAILAGTAAAVGPGVQLTVRDPGDVVDAPFLLDAVQELRDAGAEAIQIGEVRVVASTAFADVAGDGVQLDGTVVRSPYTVVAIGDPDVLVPALSIPGGVLQDLEQDGAQADIDERDEVVVDALRVPSEPQYARPAPPQE